MVNLVKCLQIKVVRQEAFTSTVLEEPCHVKLTWFVSIENFIISLPFMFGSTRNLIRNTSYHVCKADDLSTLTTWMQRKLPLIWLLQQLFSGAFALYQ